MESKKRSTPLGSWKSIWLKPEYNYTFSHFQNTQVSYNKLACFDVYDNNGTTFFV